MTGTEESLGARGAFGDAAIDDEQIADFVAARGGIDDASAANEKGPRRAWIGSRRRGHSGQLRPKAFFDKLIVIRSCFYGVTFSRSIRSILRALEHIDDIDDLLVPQRFVGAHHHGGVGRAAAKGGQLLLQHRQARPAVDSR